MLRCNKIGLPPTDIHSYVVIQEAFSDKLDVLEEQFHNEADVLKTPVAWTSNKPCGEKFLKERLRAGKIDFKQYKTLLSQGKYVWGRSIVWGIDREEKHDALVTGQKAVTLQGVCRGESQTDKITKDTYTKETYTKDTYTKSTIGYA